MPTLKVFEHQTIKAKQDLWFYKGKIKEQKPLDVKYIDALWKLYDEKKMPFFTPSRGGIKFCEYVGVIKVLDLTVEILPKADNNQNWSDEKEQSKWQNILIGMLRVCRKLNTPSVSDASLKLKSNSILDLYIERFINEVNYLINAGLIKRYRKEELNSTALKGKLLIQKHITKNIVHKEQFYVSRSTYDKDHLIHQILLKAIKILPLICNQQSLLSSCYQLQLNFPEVKDIKVDESTFTKIHLDRKSTPYETSLEIAKLLILNYRPDVSSGTNHSIAILFDMNKLWEEYVYRKLQKANKGKFIIHSQKSTSFWSTAQGKSTRYLKPDIVIEEDERKIVIDTKWKNLYNDVKNVSMDDLRQMYAYHHYFDAVECYLVYPGATNKSVGSFIKNSHFKNDLGEKSCGVIISQAWKTDNSISIEDVEKSNYSYLDENIGGSIFKELGYPTIPDIRDSAY